MPVGQAYLTVRRLGKIKDNQEALGIVQALAAWREVETCAAHQH